MASKTAHIHDPQKQTNTVQAETPKEIIGAFDILFATTFRVPVEIQSDKGKEFDNKAVKKYLTEKEISLQTTRDPATKAAICERFIRTIKGIIFKYFTHTNSTKYIDVI